MEPDTREWYSDSDDLPDTVKTADVEAEVLHRRLGNVSSIATLREEVARILPPESLIMSLVLYDGSHCGDLIGVEKMAELKGEIAISRRSSLLSPRVRDFLEDLDQLVKAAEEQQNPIVFV